MDGWQTEVRRGVLLQPNNRYRMTPGVRHSSELTNSFILFTIQLFQYGCLISKFFIISVICQLQEDSSTRGVGDGATEAEFEG